MENQLTYQDILELFKQSARETQELKQSLKETDRILTEMFRETDAKFKETDKKFKETDKKFKETDEIFKETDKYLKNLGKELGGLGKSIGNIAEGLSYPSLAKELEDKFKVDVVAPNFEVRKGGEVLEFDVFAFSNSTRNEAFIVEVKTNLSESHIVQLEKNLQKFHKFLPDFANKKVYGIICAIKASKKQIEEVYRRGFYFANVRDGFFKITEQPENMPVKYY